MSGWYWIRNNRAEVAVCTKDNFGEWDKDTLRHEAIHVIQDCIDGTIGNGIQHMFNDGEHDAIARNWDLDKMMMELLVMGYNICSVMNNMMLLLEIGI